MSNDLNTRRDDLWKASVMGYFPAHLSRFRFMDNDEVARIGTEAARLASVNPLHLVSATFAIEGYQGGLSAANVAAVMVASVWVQTGENIENAHALLTAWPDILRFAALATKGAETPYA